MWVNCDKDGSQRGKEPEMLHAPFLLPPQAVLPRETRTAPEVPMTGGKLDDPLQGRDLAALQAHGSFEDSQNRAVSLRGLHHLCPVLRRTRLRVKSSSGRYLICIWPGTQDELPPLEPSIMARLQHNDAAFG